MTKEQYVTFETAKLLKRNGFAWQCRSYYLSDGERHEHCRQEALPKGKATYPCPTQAEAMRWLREEYRMAVCPLPYRYPDKWDCMLVFLGEPMEKDDKHDMCMLGKNRPSYEESAEDGIQHATRNVVAKVRRILAESKEE